MALCVNVYESSSARERAGYILTDVCQMSASSRGFGDQHPQLPKSSSVMGLLSHIWMGAAAPAVHLLGMKSPSYVLSLLSAGVYVLTPAGRSWRWIVVGRGMRLYSRSEWSGCAGVVGARWWTTARVISGIASDNAAVVGRGTKSANETAFIQLWKASA